MKQAIEAVEADYETTRAMIYELKRRYPFLVCRCVGRSLAGRALFTLSLGRGGRRSVLMTAGWHGQEWLTVLLLLRFTERVCESLKTRSRLHCIDLCRALGSRELIIMPCVNPDGIQIALRGCEGAGIYSDAVAKISGGRLSDWNANARGVDLNHNFNAGHDILRVLERNAGIDGPSPRRFGGILPESEPETVAVTSLCRQKMPTHALAFHSQGEEIYWRYGDITPERSELMAKVFSASSGYSLVENEGLASHGGFKDWFIDEFSRPAFTVEAGRGKNPLPLSDFSEIYERLEELMTLAVIM